MEVKNGSEAMPGIPRPPFLGRDWRLKPIFFNDL
jgi:hypothetical protein